MKNKLSKKSVLLIASVAVILTVSLVSVRSRAASNAKAATAQPSTEPFLVAGPGRVEPLSENIQIGSELSGKIKSVNVEEGDTVRQGQVLAALQNDDYHAEVLSAQAQVLEKEATLRKVVNGARTQERSEALSTVRAAEAVMNNARAEMDRRQKLFDAGVISRDEFERYAREYDVAKANYQENVEHHSLVDDHPREEDRSFAEADLQLARAQL